MPLTRRVRLDIASILCSTGVLTSIPAVLFGGGGVTSVGRIGLASAENEERVEATMAIIRVFIFKL